MLLNRLYRQLHFRRCAGAPASLATILRLSWKFDCYVSRRAKIYYSSRIHLARDVRIYEDAVLNFRSDYDEHQPNLAIGEGTKVMPGAKLIPQQGWIRIGKNCTVQYGALLYGVGGLEIGDDTRIAAYSVIVPMSHVYDDPAVPIRKQGETAKGIRIGRDVWIGAGAKILDGVVIGDGAVVAAGTVVAKKVPPYSVVAGVPAMVVRRRGRPDGVSDLARAEAENWGGQV